MGHHQLRVLDRHRPRRHAHLGHSLPDPPEVAHLHQPRRRGHDPLRGHVRRHLPRHPRRPRLDGVVPRARSECLRHLAELPLAAPLGRLRGLDLLHRLRPLLVHRPRARSRHPARPRQDPRRQVPLRHLRPRLARLEPQLAPLRDGLSHPGRPLHAAGALGALGRLLRLRHLHPPRLAHHHLPALLRRRRHLRRLRHGAHHPHAREPALPAAQGHDHAQSRGQDGQDHPAHRHHRRLRLPHGAVRRLLQRRTSTRRFTFFQARSAIRSTSSASASPAKASTTGPTTA